MRRVLVLGCSGSGKSTFARRLCEATGLPYVSIDALFWQPRWRKPAPEDFDARMTEVVRQPSWVIEGNYTSNSTAGLRRERADTVFFFDLPRRVCMTGIFARTLKTYGRVRPEMAPGCPERFDLEFVHYAWTWRDRQRPKVMQFLNELRPDQPLIRLTSRREADEYLAGLAGDIRIARTAEA